MEPRQALTLAITKGRILAEALPLLARIGIRPAENIETSRKLVFDTSLPGLRLLVLRGSDVPTYVQFGAADLGIAMQLTNIARDIGEDARNGRLYLPRDWLDEAGIDPAVFLASPRFTPALGAVVRRLLDEAEIHYRRGHAGIALLPRQCQPAIRAAALIYKAIGTQIAENGHDSVNRRARTTIMHKAALLLRASQADAPDHALQALPADPAAASLVAAAALAPAAPAGIAGRGQTLTAAMHPAAGRDRGSVERVIVILTALHARQSARPAAGRPGRDNGMTAHA